MKATLTFLIAVHGLIHLLGFFKAFGLAEIEELGQDVPMPFGIIWLIAFLLFFVTVILLLFSSSWWFCGLAAVVVSQVLIVIFWEDARFGTLANLLILVFLLYSYVSWNFESRYQKDVLEGFRQNQMVKHDLLTHEDMQHLPGPVQKYLNYVGVVNKPKVWSVKIVFEGEMREKGKDWFRFSSEQYNFFTEPQRLFFMKATVRGLPTHGYHAYKEDRAGMQIKVFSWFPVVDVKGEDLFRAETVTLFNDMCLFAPATLIDNRIQWETLTPNSVKATFTNEGVSVSAILCFNEKDQLIDFVSDDRCAVDDMKRYRFSTPVGNYKRINSFILCTYGEAVWHYPDGKFTYGRFNLKNIEYNVDK